MALESLNSGLPHIVPAQGIVNNVHDQEGEGQKNPQGLILTDKTKDGVTTPTEVTELQKETLEAGEKPTSLQQDYSRFVKQQMSQRHLGENREELNQLNELKSELTTEEPVEKRAPEIQAEAKELEYLNEVSKESSSLLNQANEMFERKINRLLDYQGSNPSIPEEVFTAQANVGAIPTDAPVGRNAEFLA